MTRTQMYLALTQMKSLLDGLLDIVAKEGWEEEKEPIACDPYHTCNGCGSTMFGQLPKGWIKEDTKVWC